MARDYHVGDLEIKLICNKEEQSVKDFLQIVGDNTQDYGDWIYEINNRSDKIIKGYVLID